jgi:flagellar biogenesis protein FliO
MSVDRPMAQNAARLAALFWLAQGGVCFAQHLGQASDTAVPFWRVAGALILCLALAFAAAFLLRNRLRLPGALAIGASDRRLQLIETLRLSHQVDICLLRWDRKDFLIAATAQGATVLASAEQSAEGE